MTYLFTISPLPYRAGSDLSVIPQNVVILSGIEPVEGGAELSFYVQLDTGMFLASRSLQAAVEVSLKLLPCTNQIILLFYRMEVMSIKRLGFFHQVFHCVEFVKSSAS